VSALVLALAIWSLIMIFVVPTFEEIFLDFDTVLPGITVALIELAQVFPELLMTGGVAVVAVTAVWLTLRASPGGRRFRERVALAVPLIGPVVRDSLIARFARSLALTVSSGVPLPESLRLAAGATGSGTLERDAELLASQVEQGEPVAAASRKARVIPRMFGFVAEVGSARASLSESMFQLAKAYDARATHSQSMLRAWLVPLAVIVVGVAIGFCILALFMPLVSLINSVSC
jgi:type IV pilus assembly protein PilC